MLVLTLFVVCFLLIYRYATKNHDYWKKRNVKHDQPIPLFGNHLKNVLVRRTIPEIGIEMLNKYKGEKIVGYYRGTTPELILKDPEIIRHILAVDFKKFADRGWSENTRKDPLLYNIVFAKVEQWRDLRQKLSPCFSLNQLKNMSPQILKCTEKLERFIEGIASRGETVKAYDLLVGYTIECIGSGGFGVEMNTISRRSLLTELAKKFFDKSQLQTSFLALSEILPEATFLFNYIKIVDNDLESIMTEMSKKAKDERPSNPSGTKDLIDLFIDIAAEKLKSNAELSEAERNNASLQFITSQFFFFLFSGFETSATAISTTLHQLAHYPEIQEKIQTEIDSVLCNNDNNLMESLKEMTLLNMAFKESMRLLPPLGSVRRICAEKYTIPGTNVTIDPGVRILIPIQALHMDPNVYESPEEFRPERFAPDAGKSLDFKYLAFGEGPRKCIGYKLALLVASAGLVTILRRYTVVPAKTSEKHISVKKTSFLAQIVDGGMPIKFIAREK